ncbi:AMP-binding protein, partial [Citrobacter braakii]|uniref:AMP-binding protein n=1 Tax=Citrobacter braakii TaxID=57706 RepID=UPI00197F16C9
GYTHAGKPVDRRAGIQQISEGLPSVTGRIMVPVAHTLPDGWVDFATLTDRAATLQSRQVQFEHPLWIVYSSGTTGNPKGALIPHRALIGNLSGFVCSQNWFGFDPWDPRVKSEAVF